MLPKAPLTRLTYKRAQTGPVFQGIYSRIEHVDKYLETRLMKSRLGQESKNTPLKENGVGKLKRYLKVKTALF